MGKGKDPEPDREAQKNMWILRIRIPNTVILLVEPQDRVPVPVMEILSELTQHS